jgi:integrase
MERENNTRDRWLTVDEEMPLFHAAAPWLRELMIFAIHTGMRQGEILGLTWAGVDLFRRIVTVFKSKNGERRSIPLNQTDRTRTAEAQVWKPFGGHGVGISERSTNTAECEQYQP